MGFAQWRQQAGLVHALEALARGGPVAQVSDALGYATPSNFIAMFRRNFGQSPGRYFARRGPPARCPVVAPGRGQRPSAATRHTALPTSSATSSPPRWSSATPTGRPSALPSSLRKPVSTSRGRPCGLPSTKDTNTTL